LTISAESKEQQLDERIDRITDEVHGVLRALVIRTLEEEKARGPEPLPPLEPLLTARQVAELLAVDIQTVYRLRREGHLRAVWISETTFMFDPSEVRRFREAGGVKAAADAEAAS
jgi:excisionase family DNA binding protein